MPITKPKDAGKGDSRPYRIPEKPSGKTLSEDDYLVANAAAWYVHKDDGWFSKNQISGSVELSLGTETYNFPLGLFRLKGGTKMAPLFNQPLLPQRAYRGGDLGVRVKLKSIKSDNFLGGLLRSAASTGLGIARGLVQTATLAGPSAVLAQAGKEVLDSVQKALDEGGEGKESFFDKDSGLFAGLAPTDIAQEGTHVLFHRGTLLTDDKLSVGEVGGFAVPLYEGELLEDGCWVLLQLGTSREYTDVRPTDQAAMQLFRDIRLLVKRVGAGLITKAAAEAALAVTGDGSTLGDRGFALQSLITTDGVLTSADALSRAGDIGMWIKAAKDSIAAQNPLKHWETIVRAVFEPDRLAGGPPEVAVSAINEATLLLSGVPGRRAREGLHTRALELMGRSNQRLLEEDL